MPRGLASPAFWGTMLLIAVSAAAQPSAEQPLSDAELAAAIGALGGSDAQARVRAADLLGRRGASRREECVGPLRARLREDPQWEVRASAGRALGRLASRDAVPDLVRALRDPVVDVRVVAAAAIWRLPDPAAVPALLELLRDADPSARQWGALALGVVRDRRATAPLVTLLRDPERSVRLDAIRALGRIRDASALGALEGHARADANDMEERLEATSALATLEGPEKMNALVRLLAHDDRQVRLRAAESLGQVGDALVVPALRRRRGEESNAGVRSALDAAVREIERRASGGAGSPLNLPPMP